MVTFFGLVRLAQLFTYNEEVVYMSGIFGIGVLDNSYINTTVLKNITKSLLTCLHDMGYGDCSSGITVARDQDIHILKQNVGPKKFVELPEFITYMVNNVNKNGTNILRSITGAVSSTNIYKGTAEENNRAYIQPMRCNDIIGSHDGVIQNFKAIEEKFKNFAGFPRHTTTDSEVIWSAMNYNSCKNAASLKLDSPTTDAIIDTTRILKGTYACNILDIKTPNNVWIIRKDKPLEVAYFKSEGIVIWASDIRVVRNAIENTDFGEPIVITLNNKSGICFNLEYNNYYRFGIGADIAKSVQG